MKELCQIYSKTGDRETEVAVYLEARDGSVLVNNNLIFPAQFHCEIIDFSVSPRYYKDVVVTLSDKPANIRTKLNEILTALNEI